MTIDDMPLPECLERVDGGIRIAGHRVPLASFLHVFLRGDAVSIQELRSHFPTVPTEKLGAVSEFCGTYEDLVYNYYRREIDESRRQYAKSNGPSLSELKSRYHRQQ